MTRPPCTTIDPAALYTQYGGVVLRRVRRFFPGDAAEEILHEIFAAVVEAAPSWRGECHPFTWLYRITTHHCLNRRRNEQRRRDLLDEAGTISWSSPVSEPAQEAEILLRELWRTLDDDLVEIGIYYYVDGLTHEDIGTLMGCTGRTIGNRLKRLAEVARQHAEETA